MRSLILSFLLILSPLAGWAQGIEINDAWARASVPGARSGAAYFTLRNNGPEDDVLLGAESPAAGIVQVHKTTVDDNGMMQMEHLDEVRLPAGVELGFAPGGYHIMMIGLETALQPGLEFPLTLEFLGAGKRTVRVPIKPLNYKPEIVK